MVCSREAFQPPKSKPCAELGRGAWAVPHLHQSSVEENGNKPLAPTPETPKSFPLYPRGGARPCLSSLPTPAKCRVPCRSPKCHCATSPWYCCNEKSFGVSWSLPRAASLSPCVTVLAWDTASHPTGQRKCWILTCSCAATGSHRRDFLQSNRGKKRRQQVLGG